MAAGLLAVPSMADAELVRFTSGAVISVASYQVDGDMAVIALRDGAELRLPTSSIAEVLADEVDHSTPVALKAPATTPTQLAWTRALLEAKVDEMADKVGVNRKLARAVVLTESNFVPGAVSSKGAMGLMRITADVAKDYGVANPFDPEANLKAGLQYLRDLVGRLGLPNGLAAYNAGEAVVSRYGGIPPYRETQDYVRQILSLLRR